MDRVEQLSISRRRMWLGFLVGYGLSHGASIVASFMMDPEYGIRISKIVGGILSVCSLGGFAVFAVYLVRLILVRKHISGDPELESAVNDELVKHNRFKAYRIAFFAVVLGLLVMIFGSYLYPPLVRYGAHSALYIVIMSFIGAFLWYEWQADHD
ncbi:hypothetical protein JW979_11070 [bacterium]|nr:hypothetical protein [candidate division CSSED10-310 bacterium]